MSQYQIEVMLRPAVEFYAAAVTLSAAMIMWVTPEMLFLPKAVSEGAVVLLLIIAAIDSYRGWRVLRYRAGMRRTPYYAMQTTQIPKARDKLFLGKGFRWTQQHTQRLADTFESRYATFIEVADNYDPLGWIRRGILSVLPFLKPVLNANTMLNPFKEPPMAGGSPTVHGVEPIERNIFIGEEAREGNSLFLGTTGVGKTRWLEILLAQDIVMPSKDVVIVVDPKGDSELLSRMYSEAKRVGRERELSVFHLGFPNHSARYNAIGHFSRISEIATRVANQLPGEGNASSFKEFAWRFVNIAARALIELGERPEYKEIRQAIDDIEPLFIRYIDHQVEKHDTRQWLQRIAILEGETSEDDKPRNFEGRTLKGFVYYKLVQEYGAEFDDTLILDMAACIKYDKTYYDKLVSSVGPLLEKLTSGKSGELLAPNYLDKDDERGMFDWGTVIRKRGIVYIGLDALSDVTVSSAVGQSMLSDLTSVAGEIYKHGAFGGAPSEGGNPRIYLHFDEVNEIIGDEFIPLVNKCRAAGMVVNAYTQAWHDIEARVGSSAKAEQITANFNNLFMMRVRNMATAELLTSQLPEVNINTLMAVSGATDSDYTTGSHFTSRNEDRISSEKTAMLHPSTMMQLPKGQAFGLLEGGRLYKIRLPLPVQSEDEKSLPTGVAAIVESMRSAIVPSNWSDEEPWWNNAPTEGV